MPTKVILALIRAGGVLFYDDCLQLLREQYDDKGMVVPEDMLRWLIYYGGVPNYRKSVKELISRYVCKGKQVPDSMVQVLLTKGGVYNRPESEALRHAHRLHARQPEEKMVVEALLTLGLVRQRKPRKPKGPDLFPKLKRSAEATCCRDPLDELLEWAEDELATSKRPRKS